MYHLGYYEHYLELRKKYPQFKFNYPRDWSLKEYGTLFIYDLINLCNAKRVLEVGCGFDTFFSENMSNLGVEHWVVDKSNNYLGIGADSERFNSVMNQRKNYGTRFVNGLLGDNLKELPDNYFDLIFSISVIEHIDDSLMSEVANEIKRTLRVGGTSAHSVDIYSGSRKAESWHISTKHAGLVVDPPYYDKWEFDGKYTTFIESPKVRYLIYNSLSHADPFSEGVPYVSQFATMLCVASKNT